MSDATTSTHTRYFRSWGFDRRKGRIGGAYELSEQQCPQVHCRLVEDDQGLLLRIEEYRAESENPFVKVLSYAGESEPRITEALDYNPDGSLRLIHRYVYDGDGPLIDRIEWDGGGLPRGHITSRWEDGVEVEEVAWDTGEKIRSRYCYTRDDRDNIVREQIYGSDGQLEGTREMDYDERGNVTEKRWFSADGTLQSRFVQSFRADDLVESIVLYDGTGTVRGRRRFEYDAVGNTTNEFR